MKYGVLLAALFLAACQTVPEQGNSSQTVATSKEMESALQTVDQTTSPQSPDAEQG